MANKKTIALVLSELESLPKLEQRKVVRCALLRAGQWALDCTTTFPSASTFRLKFAEILIDCIRGLIEIYEAVTDSPGEQRPQIVCLNVPAVELHSDLWETQIRQKPNLIVTSPPYPSIHVLYHRWQINSRREISAPYWIADELDGRGTSYYTMGSRTPTGLNNYFKAIENSFSQLHSLLAEEAIVVQLLAFSNILEQLPRYLGSMENAGFQEYGHTIDSDSLSGRLWRQVPLRRWYASFKGNISSSHEVLLIHRRL